MDVWLADTTRRAMNGHFVAEKTAGYFKVVASRNSMHLNCVDEFQLNITQHLKVIIVIC